MTPMLLLVLVGVSFAESPWAGKSADVAVERTIDASPESLAARLDSTVEIAKLMPEECVHSWEHTDATGPARVTYQIKAFKRRLTARLNIKDPGRVIELDHEGKKGFITRFLLTETPKGTRVTLTSFLNPPTWPFRKYYYEAVRPDWVVCYEKVLSRLEEPE